jgi:hypothetical protein
MMEFLTYIDILFFILGCIIGTATGYIFTELENWYYRIMFMVLSSLVGGIVGVILLYSLLFIMIMLGGIIIFTIILSIFNR